MVTMTIIIVLFLIYSCVADLCVIDQQLCQDENSLLSFEAICSIHKLMDDDADGTVDTSETDGVRQNSQFLVFVSVCPCHSQ